MTLTQCMHEIKIENNLNNTIVLSLTLTLTNVLAYVCEIIQASMVTSSATRNTIYRSFALRENIGDITAKGEAQIAVVDMLGILSGILLCNAVGTFIVLRLMVINFM